MYIPPNTVIDILEGVPLTSDYENTVNYEDVGHQVQAFEKYRKFRLDNYSYQRNNLNMIKVQVPYESLYKCNYLMFKNTNFENKWFFCFIENVSYVSNNVTAIYYKEDVLQTWWYDFKFLDSFVDRRHETKDTLFANIQPEGLDIGQYYLRGSDKPLPADQLRIWMQEDTAFYIIISDISGIKATEHTTIYDHGLINNIYSGLYLIKIAADIATGKNMDEVKTMIERIDAAGRENAVTAFYIGPSSTNETSEYRFNVSIPGNTRKDGYQPKNAKLYSSPYHIIYVDNNLGSGQRYNPEQISDENLADGLTLNFQLQKVAFPNPGARLVPYGYHGLGSPVSYSVVYLNFPTNSFSGSSFDLWWSQSKNSYLQALNAIDASYDTNQRIAQNNYDMATRSARNSQQQATNNIGTSLSTAKGSIEAQRQNMTYTLNYANRQNAAEGAGKVVTNLAQGKIGSAASEGMSAAMAYASNALDASNQYNSLAAQQAAAEMNAGTSAQNAQLSYDLAMENAATSKANSNLSNLTAKANAVNSLMAKKRDIENVPNAAKLNASADGLNWGSDGAFILIGEYWITDDYLKRIDDYFTCYGYAQNRLFTADELNDRVNRKHYTFLRTVGCNIKGTLNDQDAVTIRSIFDNGITIWDTLEDVGDYSLDNGTK